MIDESTAPCIGERSNPRRIFRLLRRAQVRPHIAGPRAHESARMIEAHVRVKSRGTMSRTELKPINVRGNLDRIPHLINLVVEWRRTLHAPSAKDLAGRDR